MRPAALSLVLAPFLALAASADVVFLKAGQRLEGDVAEKPPGYELKNEFGTWTFTKEEVLKIVPSLEKMEAQIVELHKQARALYDEALKIEGDVKTSNARLRQGLDFLQKIQDLYTEAIDVYTDPKYGDLSKSLGKIMQEKRLYRDKMGSEAVAAVPSVKPKPPTPPPVVTAPAVRPKRVPPDPSALLAKATAGDVEAMAALGIHYDDRTWGSVEGLRWLKAAAEKGHERAMYRMGLLSFLGKGVKQDYKEAQLWWTKADAADSALARVGLGRLEWKGALGPKSIEKAWAWCEKGLEGLQALVEKRDPEAMTAYGWMHLEGLGRAQDVSRALELLKGAVEEDSAAAALLLGQAYREGRPGLDAARGEAETWLRKAADAGSAEAMVCLGELFDEYTGFKNDKKDFARALPLYQKASEQGHPRAQYRLALMHLDGKGTAKAPAQAAPMLQVALRAATDDFLKALLNDLGYVSERGLGMKADVPASLKYYQRAADLGSLEAQYNLGSISLEKNNDRDALKWFLLAAKSGHPLAQNNLGAFYAAGRGVKKNLIEAEKWFLMAAQQGDASAAENLKKLQRERGGRK